MVGKEGMLMQDKWVLVVNWPLSKWPLALVRTNQRVRSLEVVDHRMPSQSGIGRVVQYRALRWLPAVFALDKVLDEHRPLMAS